MASQFHTAVTTSTDMAAIINRTLGSIPGINTTIHHAMAGIQFTTAIISVVVMHPEAIIEVIIEAITHEGDAGEGIMVDVTKAPKTECVPTKREAFKGFPRFLLSRRFLVSRFAGLR